MDVNTVCKFYQFGPGRHDFYRCVKCQTLFTQEYERERLAAMTQERATFIHCTSLRYQPAVPRWFEWLLPRVLSYSAKVVLARVVAPWAFNHAHHRIEWLAYWLASNKTTR